MKYYAITETVSTPIYIEPKVLSEEEYKQFLEDFYTTSSYSNIQSYPDLPKYMTIPMSEETYKFISSVANIYSTSFGEKEYKINKVKFKIFTEEEYELRYGKYEQI